MSRSREALVGLVIVAGIAVAVIGTLWLGGANFGRATTEVQALLRDVGQLAPGNAVKFRGVAIGRVSEIQVEPDGEAVRVTLLLDGDIAMAPDAALLVAPESMFGDWQAEIVTRSRFPRFDYYAVPEGETALPGYALPDISRLTAAADEISENLSTLTDRFDRAFNEETAENLRAAIENFQAVSQALNEVIGQESEGFGQVLADVKTASGEIAEAAQAANSTFDRLDRILATNQVDSLVANTAEAARHIRDLSDRLSAASERIEGTLDRADSAFSRVDRITARVANGEGSLGRLLVDSTLVMRAEDVLHQLDLLIADLRANPKRYVRLSIF